MKVLVTGAAGFIGFHTAKALLDRGDRVVGLETAGRALRSARLESGAAVRGEWFVNATGAWAPALCRLIGLEIPVAPLPMMAYYFETRASVDGFPLKPSTGISGSFPIRMNSRPA